MYSFLAYTGFPPIGRLGISNKKIRNNVTPSLYVNAFDYIMGIDSFMLVLLLVKLKA